MGLLVLCCHKVFLQSSHEQTRISGSHPGALDLGEVVVVEFEDVVVQNVSHETLHGFCETWIVIVTV